MSAKPPACSREQFAELVASTLIANHKLDDEVMLDRDHFAIVVKDSLGRPYATINLHMFYSEFCYVPEEERPQVIQRAAVLPGSGDADLLKQDLSRLRIQIKDRFSIEEANLKLRLGLLGPAGDESIPFSVFGGHFAYCIVEDLPNQMRYISAVTLEGLSLTFDEAFAIGIENLMQTTPKEIEFDSYGDSQTGDTIAVESIWQDSYDAARVGMLLDDILNLPFNGIPLIYLISHDRVLITDSNSETAQAMALAAFSEAEENSRTLPPFPIVQHEDEVLPYVFSLTEPLGMRQFEYLKSIYGLQAESLKGEFNQLLGGWHLGIYTVLLAKDARTFTATGVDQSRLPVLIPDTDYIVFTSDSKVVATVETALVFEVLGEDVEGTDYYPARYLVTRFPTPAEIAEMGESIRIRNARDFT